MVVSLVILALSPVLALTLFFIAFLGGAQGLLEPSALALQRRVFVLFTPWHRQVAVTITEFQWGLASLVGVPLSGLLMAVDFRLPFLLIAALLFVLVPVLIGVLHQVPVDQQPEETAEDDNGSEFSSSQQANSDASATDTDSAGVSSSTSSTSSCWSTLSGLLRSRPTMSNGVDAFLATMLMAVKDLCFGLWLTERYDFGQAEVATASIVLGGADIVGEIALTLLLLKARASASGLAIPVSCLVGTGGALFWAVARAGAPLGLAAYFVLSCFTEIKAVQTLALAATIDEDSVRAGHPEVVCYTGHSLGFATGTLLAPLLWRLGSEAALGVLFMGVCGAAVMLKLAVLGPRDVCRRHKVASVEPH
jgi:Major Facilitator Superfamily